MPVHYSPILKAKTGEFRALKELSPSARGRIAPMLDFDLPDEGKTGTDADQILGSVKKLAKANPPSTLFVDAFQWPADAQVATGDHVISFIVSAMRAAGLNPIPVIGYDRWEDDTYKLAIANLGAGPDGRFAIRLDRSVMEDIYSPDDVVSTLEHMLSVANGEPSLCFVFIDLEDVSGGSSSVASIIDDCSQVLDAISHLGFAGYVIAGSSVPEQVGLAVPQRDTTSTIARKEQIAWRSLRVAYPELPLVAGDYGVRGPTSYSGPNPNMNGKIRYTTDRVFFVARGHAVSDDGSFIQMHDLAQAVVISPHYRGPAYSWGDAQIADSAAGGVRGNMTTWIGIDTNHHLHATVDEVIDFELTVGDVAEAVF